MDERVKKINDLLCRETFLNELKKASNDKEVQALFGKNGVDLSLEEIQQMVDESIKAHEMEASGELNESMLENVAGGSFALLLAVGSVAFYASYGYHKYYKK